MMLSFVMLISGLCGFSISAFAEENNDIVKLSVTYHLNSEEGNMIAEPYYADMQKGSSYEVISPEIDNYILKNNEYSVVSGILNEDKEIKVVYTYDDSNEVDYKINYVGVNSTGTETILESETGKAPVNTTVSVPFKEFKGYEKRNGQDMQLLVTADGKAEKNVYYDKSKNPYIIFQTQGTYVEPIMAEAGSDISGQISNIESPKRQGYKFAGWDKKLPAIMPDEDLIVNALWDSDKVAYTVVCWGENPNDDGYTILDNTEIRYAKTGSTVYRTKEDIARGETTNPYDKFYGYDYDEAQDSKAVVTGDGNAVLNLYYKREIWTVNIYDKGYSIQDRKIWKTFSGKYESRFPKEFPTSQELKEKFKTNAPIGEEFQGLGYRESAIRDEEDYVILDTIDLTKFDMEDYVSTTDGTGRGSKIINLYPVYHALPYEVIFEIQKETLEENKFETDIVLFSRTDVKPNSIARSYRSTEKGFTWENAKWQKGSGRTEALNNKLESVRQKDNGAGEFYRLGDYNIAYERRVRSDLKYVSNQKVVKSQNDVMYETEVDLDYIPDNGKENFVFAGWYLSPSLFYDSSPLTEYKMPDVDLTLYAKWDSIDVNVNFDTQGGSAVDSQNVPHNGKVVMPQDPTKEGYTFSGWYTSADGEERWSFDRLVDGELTLYAHWRPISKTGYTVRHIMQGENKPFFEESVNGGVGDTVVALPLYPKHGSYPQNIYLKTEDDSTSKSLTLKENADENVITFTYINAAKTDYIVKYLNKLTNEEIAGSKTVTTLNTIVTEDALDIENFKLDSDARVTQDIKEKNEIIFYYVPSNLKVIYQFTSGIDGMELPEAVTSLAPVDDSVYMYGDTVMIKKPVQDVVIVDNGQWVFKGYQLSESSIVIEDNMTITGYWEFIPSGTETNHAPIIMAEDKKFALGAEFNDTIALQGVTASDREDGDISEKVTVLSHNVNTDVVGTYQITYTVTDSKGTTTTKTVNAVVCSPTGLNNRFPVITAVDKTFFIGDEWNNEVALKDVTAYDEEDGDVTGSLEIVEHNVDTSVAGSYYVTYKATDSQGASSTKTINVTVLAAPSPLNHAPVITANDRMFSVGDFFDESIALQDVTAYDEEDGDLTGVIEIIENTVDTSKSGTYYVTYKVTDAAGESSTKTINVVVKDKEEIPDNDQRPTHSSENPDRNVPQTGDHTNIILWLSLLVVYVFLIAIIGIRRNMK